MAARSTIFISHISEEKDIAICLKDALLKHFLGNVEVFVSSDGISVEAGAKWLDAITEAVERADLMITLCSRTSTTRPWINFECGTAWLHGTPIVPACHGHLTPQKLEPPLSYLQAVTLDDPQGLERLYQRVAQVVECNKPEPDFAALASELEQLSERAYRNRKHPTPNVAELIAERIDGTKLGWTLCFLGEDPLLKAGELVSDLERPFSNDGHGKRLASGFIYVCIGPTLAWKRAVDDPLYAMMQTSIRSFPERWRSIRKTIKKPMHYVSLGIGTGEKDLDILDHLYGLSKSTYFFPTDMSAEMLRVGINNCLKDSAAKRSKTLPIQIDFSVPRNIDAIGRVVSAIVEDGPVLYSLLGNTLANFESDDDLLASLSRLLGPGDALLLEIASTAATTEREMELMKTEYATSHNYREFVTSALESNTFISPSPPSLQFLGSDATDGQLVLRIVYRNLSSAAETVHLVNGKTTELMPDETICLTITRKYTRDAMLRLAANAGLEVVMEPHIAEPENASGFSLACMLLRRPQA